jgi:uncharacterized protein YqgV (UPF0045/DUF77 family)
VSYRRLLALVMLAGMPATAAAQFTTFIPPQTRVADSVKAVVAAAEKAQTDSAVNMQLTNMKTWVDSAAGISTPPVTAADSATVGLATVPETTTFTNGARAPETASDLPTLVLIGAVLLALGTLLLADRRPSRHRA